MAKFKFIGDPDNEELIPDVITMFGVDFKKGEASEVEDETAIGKFRGNSHFKEVTAKDAKKEPAKKADPKKADKSPAKK